MLAHTCPCFVRHSKGVPHVDLDCPACCSSATASVSPVQGWLDARKRVGNNVLRDFNGMNYLVPMGMVSTQVRGFCWALTAAALCGIKRA